MFYGLKKRIKVVIKERKRQEFQAQRVYEEYQRFKIKILSHLNEEDIKEPIILEIGCGMRLPFAIQFINDGFKYYGSEIVATGKRFSIKKYFRAIFVNEDILNLIENLAWDFLLCGRFHKELSKIYGKKMGNKQIKKANFFFHNIENLDIPENFADVIITNSVFEHVDDLNRLLLKMKQILKLNGITYNQIHLYPSLSGGHDEWSFPELEEPRDIPPWSHIRTDCDYKTPVNIFLNKYKQSVYEREFEKKFGSIEIENIHVEGEKLLNEDILKSIPDEFTRDDLLNRNVAILAKNTN